jgi:hypothetical protein
LERHTCPGPDCDESTFGEQYSCCGNREYCNDCPEGYRYVKILDDDPEHGIVGQAKICPDCSMDEYVDFELERPDVIDIRY